MKRKIISIVLVGALFIPVFSQNPSLDKNWQVVFEDDFSAFNTGRWHKAHNHIHGNYEYNNPKKQGEEPQVYIQDNAYIENGKLVLRTKKQTCQCPKGSGYLNCQYGGSHSYTSGQISSNTAYKYGYFEIYAKLPGSSGYWPAFWLWNNTPSTQTSNCWYNEIDIIEAYGHKPGAVESNSHCFTTCPIDFDHLNHLGIMEHACSFATGYHWYGVEWDKNKITWYVDRKAVRQIVNNRCGIGIQNSMYIILNVALYPWDNVVNSNTVFPDYMYIDQANYYKLKYDCETIVNEILNYDTFNYAVKKSISLSGVSSLTSGQNVSLRATNFIELKDDFTVPLGAELYLDITSCENPNIKQTTQ
jgi:beta-glucanase (GH16 family)